MANRPAFQPAPRLYAEVPGGQVEIPPPPPAPPKQTTSLVTVLLPAFMGAVMLVVTLMTPNPLSGVSSGFMVIGSLVALSNYFSQRRKNRQEVGKRDSQYRALLNSLRVQLDESRTLQRCVSNEIDPDPAECLRRAESLDQHLWERAPEHADFMCVRLGTGSHPFAIKIKAPRQDNVLEPDPLLVAAQELQEEFGQVDGVPVCLPLPEAQAAGLAGQRNHVLNMVRAMALGIATHHAPDEVKLVAVFPSEEAASWEWLRWLPHAWSADRQHRYLASDIDSTHHLLSSLYDLLSKRKLTATLAHSADSEKPSPVFVFLLADPRLVERDPILHLLLREGAALGAFPIFLADGLQDLPKGCQAIAAVQDGQSQLIRTGPSGTRTPFQPDQVSLDLAERTARALARVHLSRMASPSQIPRSVPLLGVLGVDSVDGLDLVTRWQTNEPYRSLAIPVGLRAGAEPLLFDLHERQHGPHGLVAGTTGSGKSELLQSLVAALAATYHPHELVFVLIDYKGGGTANAFAELPHLVGTITNLQGNLAARALAAIKSELKRRQTLLAQAGLNHIDDYQRRRRQGSLAEPLPHLAVVADEFAELATEQPDFMRELVGAVRVGRSLGVHLILATQKPAGVVNEQIWSNTRFRICLRVERPEDSQEVLKRPDAANLTAPGRAYLQVGNNELFELFQAAYAGAPYTPGGQVTSDPEEIAEVALDGERRSLRLSPKPMAISVPSTHLQVLVKCIHDVAEREGIRPLPGPWLEPLPEEVTLASVQPSGGWDGRSWQPPPSWLAPVVGLLDDPTRQYQGPLTLDLGREGHLAIYGAPSSGKTTLLQTLVTALVSAHAPDDVHVYILDFGGRLLTQFAPLPHVGAVILAGESERLDRLLAFLLRELERRKELLTKAGVGSLMAYRSIGNEPIAAIVIVLDNYTGFANAYPDAEETLGRIAREGANLGVHVVLTASSPSAVRSRLANSITLAVALQLADRGDYSTAVGRAYGLEPAPIPGRGLVKGTPPLEFQTALPVAGDSEVERSAALKELIERMSQAWHGDRAKPVAVLPTVVPLCQLIDPADVVAAPSDPSLAVPFAVSAGDLEPFQIDLNDGPHFLITGPIQSGKTTCLQSWLLALAARLPPSRALFHLVDFGRSGLYQLTDLPHTASYVDDDTKLDLVLISLEQELGKRRRALDEARRADISQFDERAWLAGLPALVVAIDDLSMFLGSAQPTAKERLEQMVRRNRGLGIHILLAGACSDVASSYESLVRALKELQTGLLLGTSDHGDLQIFNLRLPLGEVGKTLDPGRGYFVRRGRFRQIQVTSCHDGSVTLSQWITIVKARVAKATDSGGA